MRFFRSRFKFLKINTELILIASSTQSFDIMSERRKSSFFDFKRPLASLSPKLANSFSSTNLAQKKSAHNNNSMRLIKSSSMRNISLVTQDAPVRKQVLHTNYETPDTITSTESLFDSISTKSFENDVDTSNEIDEKQNYLDYNELLVDQFQYEVSNDKYLSFRIYENNSSHDISMNYDDCWNDEYNEPVVV